jgi:hypothetical protein
MADGTILNGRTFCSIDIGKHFAYACIRVHDVEVLDDLPNDVVYFSSTEKLRGETDASLKSPSQITMVLTTPSHVRCLKTKRPAAACRVVFSILKWGISNLTLPPGTELSSKQEEDEHNEFFKSLKMSEKVASMSSAIQTNVASILQLRPEYITIERQLPQNTQACRIESVVSYEIFRTLGEDDSDTRKVAEIVLELSGDCSSTAGTKRPSPAASAAAAAPAPEKPKSKRARSEPRLPYSGKQTVVTYISPGRDLDFIRTCPAFVNHYRTVYVTKKEKGADETIDVEEKGDAGAELDVEFLLSDKKKAARDWAKWFINVSGVVPEIHGFRRMPKYDDIGDALLHALRDSIETTFGDPKRWPFVKI